MPTSWQRRESVPVLDLVEMINRCTSDILRRNYIVVHQCRMAKSLLISYSRYRHFRLISSGAKRHYYNTLRYLLTVEIRLAQEECRGVERTAQAMLARKQLDLANLQEMILTTGLTFQAYNTQQAVLVEIAVQEGIIENCYRDYHAAIAERDAIPE